MTCTYPDCVGAGFGFLCYESCKDKFKEGERSEVARQGSQDGRTTQGGQGRTQDTPAPVQRGAEGAAQHLGHDQHTGEEN